MFLADYLYSSRLYIYVVVGSIVEAIEAMYSRKTVFHYLVFATRKAEVFKKRLRVDRNIYVSLSRNVSRARGAQHTPMIDIFFCLEWLKVKPSALNLSQALLFRKSGQKKKKTPANKKQVMPRDGSQIAFQETRAGKNIGQILPQASNKKIFFLIQAFYLMRSF